MKHRLLKTLTSLVLVALMVVSLLPAIALGTSAATVTGTFEKFTGTELVEGDYVIVYENGAMNTTVSSGRLGFATVAPSNDAIENPDEAIVWHIAQSGDNWTIYNNAAASYAASTGAKNKAQLLTDATDEKAQWTVTVNSDGTVDFTNVANKTSNVNATLRKNSTYGFACYATATGGALTLYKLTETAPGEHAHEWNWDGVTGTNGQHTQVCADTDGLCDISDRLVNCTWDAGTVTTPATCVNEGEKTYTCEICSGTKVEVVEATGEHTYVDGICSVCSASEPAAPSYGNLAAEFQFGDNGNATHADGSTINAGQAYTSGTYTLTFSALTKVSGGARDAKGNSALKLGTSSAVASLTFTVPADVTTVVINIAGYKTNTAVVDVNGTEYTISTLSNNGEYTAIEVDTSTTKTVTLSTLTSGKRAMIDSIAFYIPAGDASCTHTNTEEIPAVAPGCTTVGATASVKCSDCGFIVTAPEPVAATGHNVVNGTCSVCGTKINYTIPEAVAAADGTAVVVSGTVCLINEDGWAQYGNMTVTIRDAAGNELYLYRLATQVAIGDVITVTGVMGTYSGTRQIAAGATATIDGHEEVEVVYDEVTIPEAIASDDGRLVTFSGTVTNVASAWTGSNMNITVSDAEGNSIYLYKLQTQVKLGDVITVKGIVDTYNGTKQIASATAEITDFDATVIAPKFTGFAISLNKGITIKVNATLVLDWMNANVDSKVVFENAEGDVLMDCTKYEGPYTYALNLTPAAINSTIYFKIYDGNNTAVVSQEVSFSAYKTKAEAASETKLGLTDGQYNALIALLGEIQDYANAANSNGNETGNLDSVTDISKNDENGMFASIGASLGDTASLKIGINGNVTGYTVVVTLGGEEIVNGELASYININGLYPVHFNDEIVITISNGTETVASATFTFNSCLKALYEYEGSSDAVKQMAVATYNYGVAVEAYKSAE